MNPKIYASEKDYWNDAEIVSFFATNAPSEYWQDFFAQFAEPDKIKVLDLGCGGGRNTRFLLEQGFDVNACDLHREMVNATRNKAFEFLAAKEAQERIIEANMQHLPYKDNSFDVIVANGVFHNVSSREEFIRAISETSRVLKPLGLLCLNLFTADYIDPTLIKVNSAGLFKTPNQIDMLLLTSEDILQLMKEQKLSKHSEMLCYNSDVFTGTRSVLRGVLQKLDCKGG